MLSFGHATMSTVAPERRRSYVMHGAIAAGGMATVHLGRLVGPAGFARRVAIKRLHPQLAHEPEVAAAFVDEARLSARVAHANVAPIIDVVSADGELLLIMDYIHGESLGRLLAAARVARVKVPVPIIVSVVADLLQGLHAAHEAVDEDGAPLRIIHRDVSPQNVIVGADGISRVVDFGIAKAIGSAPITREGQIKGKMAYMAPEQLLRRSIDRRVDVYAAGVILWEALAGRRLFEADDEPMLFGKILEDPIAPPSRTNPGVPSALDDVALTALSRDPDRRFATARDMALALEAAALRAPPSAVAEWVDATAHEALTARKTQIAEMEREARSTDDEARDSAIPSAAVVFHASGTNPGAATHVTKVVRIDEPAKPRRSRLRIGALIALLLLIGGGIALAGSRGISALETERAQRAEPPPPPTPIPPPVDSVVAIPTAAPAAPPASAPPAATPPRPATGAATGKVTVTATGGHGSHAPSQPPTTQWCKVFDPARGVFVVKAMRVARCP